ncbi:MAG: hypothetical protein ACREDV_07790 [Methylocella sp.]
MAPPRARIVAMRLPTSELLALACPGKPHRVLAAHRQGWTIETMFANLKTKGFNLEDTHISDPGKLSTLQSGAQRLRRAVVAFLQGFPRARAPTLWF